MNKYIKILIEILLALIIIACIWFIMNYQNKVNNKKGAILNHAKVVEEIEQSNSTTAISLTRSSAVELPVYNEGVYGLSENGRSLNYYSIEPKVYDSTIMLVFALHGYEGNYDKDGQVLVDAANELVKFYKESDINFLNDKRLIVIPCANPDGLNDGISEDSFGRFNAKGIDLNRDFNKENIAKESKSLIKLVQAEKPNIIIDFHGWEDYTTGNKELGKIFKENMSINHIGDSKEDNNGSLWSWAESQGIKSLLVEFKDDTINRDNLKISINKIIEM